MVRDWTRVTAGIEVSPDDETIAVRRCVYEVSSPHAPSLAADGPSAPPTWCGHTGGMRILMSFLTGSD
jgi:hypothetical protein